MKGILLLSILNIRGNSMEQKFHPAGENPETDTAQWWITDDVAYSTRTYAQSCTFRTAIAKDSKDKTLPMAEATLKKDHGDETSLFVKIVIDNIFDEKEVRPKLAAHGLKPTISLIDGLYPVWRYGTADYSLDAPAEKETFGQKLLVKMLGRLNDLKNR